ncbi:MAG TPA: hypothetical protein VM754_05275, partial [Actinomycetota bacterium]|nr:hypothetical protein [Actinomycetota bacterium]
MADKALAFYLNEWVPPRRLLVLRMLLRRVDCLRLLTYMNNRIAPTTIEKKGTSEPSLAAGLASSSAAIRSEGLGVGEGLSSGVGDGSGLGESSGDGSGLEVDVPAVVPDPVFDPEPEPVLRELVVLLGAEGGGGGG